MSDEVKSLEEQNSEEVSTEENFQRRGCRGIAGKGGGGNR